MTYVIHPGDDRDAWLTARSGTVGSSEIATVLGPPWAGPWADREALILDKLGITRERDDPTLAMHWGRHLEAGILSGMALHTLQTESGLPIPAGELEPWGELLGNEDFPGMSATPDARTWGGVVEIKNPGHDKRRWWKDGPPLYYVAQLQAQLAITGLPYGWIATLFGNRGMVHTWGFEADTRLHSEMRDKVASFWLDVQQVKG